MCSCNSSVVAVVVVVVYPSICLSSASWKTKLFREISSIFELDNVKTKQFCETSSTLELDNIKSETSLRDFLNL